MKFWPQWTHRVVTEGTGRDPLGLSRVSDLLTDYLLPGIITTTNRARYYSFYTWAISDVSAEREAAGRRFSFEAEFQRREAAFAITSQLGAKTDLTIVGSEKLKGKLAEAEADGTADTGFPVLLDPLGGYGNYYQGCLQALRLTGFDDEGFWTVPDGPGRALVNEFIAATRGAPYLKGDWRHQKHVPLDVLKKSAGSFSLDGLGAPAAARERMLLTEMFFSLDQKPQALTPLNRQATLGQFLQVLQSYADAGLEILRGDVDWASLFWPHYYDCIAEPDGRPRRFESPPQFADMHAFWRQFCAHQFLAFALEELLAAVLDALVHYPQGLPEGDLIESLVSDTFLDDLKQTLGRNCSRPDALLNAVGVTGTHSAAQQRAIVKRFGAGAKINEWEVCWNRDVSPQTRFGRAVLLLALLYGKWRSEDEDKAFALVEQRGAGDLWLGTIFPWIDGWITDRLDWRAAAKLLLEWMLHRHDTVKFQKRKLEASWFEVADGRWLKQQDITPSFRASRHRNAVTILQDLGLIDHALLDEPLMLTSEGRNVLKKVIRLRT